MFGRRITLMKLLGIPIRVDASWLLLAAFISWMTWLDFRAQVQPPLAALLAGVATLAVFGCIVLHELAHSVVARRRGMPVSGITLFLLGGVAEMESEPQRPSDEFLMAIAGPLASLVLAGAFAGLLLLAGAVPAAAMILRHLALLNLVIAIFNMIPAFPLDGGRVLRSILWAATNVMTATRIASYLGVAFGILLVVAGIAFVIFGQGTLAGVQWIILGLFLTRIARLPYRQLLLGRALEGETVRHYMDAAPLAIEGTVTVAQLAVAHLGPGHERMFLVVDGARALGVVTGARVRAIPREEWGRHAVSEIAIPLSIASIDADADATRALDTMRTTGLDRLIVTESGRISGSIRASDLLRAMADRASARRA